MSGKQLKEIVMQATGFGFVEIANKMGITSQALNTIFKSPDVKTGHLENLVRSLGLTLDVIYPDLCMRASNKSEIKRITEAHTHSEANENNIVMQHLMEMNDRLMAVIEGRNKI